MVKLIFIHIPKTGGISFLRTLHHVYGEDNVRQIWDYLKPYNDIELIDMKSFWTQYADFRKYAECKLRDVDVPVLHGHIPAWCLDGLFPGVPRITWLRNPIDQVTSRVFHYRRVQLPGWDWNPWVLARQPWFRNCQFFYTGGMLTQFYYVGILERYDHDLAELGKKLGWEDTTPYHLHITNFENDLRAALLGDEDYRAEMHEINYRDVALYDWARRGHAVGTA